MVTSILDKMLQPATDQMPREFARKLLELRASDDLQSRIEELRVKANSGQISGEEELEYKEFVEAVDIEMQDGIVFGKTACGRATAKLVPPSLLLHSLANHSIASGALTWNACSSITFLPLWSV